MTQNKKEQWLKEFEKRFFLTIKLSYNVQCVELKSFLSSLIDNWRREGKEEAEFELSKLQMETYKMLGREEVIRKIDKIYKEEWGINNWLDLKEKLLKLK